MIMLQNSTLAQDLTAALDDEYRAQATYLAVIEKFGLVAPFKEIVEAEARHIAALLPMFDKYGIAIPTNRWLGNVDIGFSLLANCEAGVEGEICNYQMYDLFLSRTFAQDVRNVFLSLRNASANHHLPAFQACVTQYKSGLLNYSPNNVSNRIYGQQEIPSRISMPSRDSLVGFAVGLGVSWFLLRRLKH